MPRRRASGARKATHILRDRDDRPPTEAAHHRRLGLRRRRRHPGRPEGVRPLWRPRHERDHGDHGQNTVAVTAVYPLPPQVIVDQVRAVVEDIGVDAVKIGMLGTRETIAAVAEALDLIGDAPVVLDPVMVAESGGRLLDEDAEEALRTLLLPRVTVVTPNLPEARVLAARGRGRRARSELARAIHALGPARRRRHRRPPRARPSTSSSTASGSSRSRASATRRAPRTARAARTPRRSPRTWRSVSIRSRPPSGRRRSPRRPCATG